MNDVQKRLADAMTELCKEQGWPITIYKIPIIKELDDAVNKYIMRIEEAHKKAVNSTLRFRYNLI